MSLNRYLLAIALIPSLVSAQSAYNYVDAANAFGYSGLQRLIQEQSGDNIIYSPLSAHLALSMAMNGAGGRTLEEMAATLNVGVEDLTRANQAVSLLLQDLNSRPESELKLTVANGVWTRPDFRVNDAFVRTLMSDYWAEVAALDSAGQINAWAEQKTNGLIKNIIDDVSGLEMLLANATYFKADWSTPFEKAQPGEFTDLNGVKQSAMLMKVRLFARHLETPELEAVELPYGSQRTASMILVVPGGDFKAFRRELSARKVGEIIGELLAIEPRHGEVTMPKIEFKTAWEMKDALSDMGMPTAFTDNADFSRLSPDRVRISKVKQDAAIKITEKGTEAAAVTTIGFEATSIFVPAFHFVADRPVFYLIRDNKTGLILFAGQIVKP